MTSDSGLIALVPDAADEGTHQPDDSILWSETHYLDAVAPDAESGVYARLGRLANQGRSHVMLAVVRPGAGPMLLADPAAPLPAVDGTDLALSASGSTSSATNAAASGDLSIATVIDLRTPEEVERTGKIRPSEAYAYHHLPMSDVLPDTTDTLWSSPEFVAAHYGDMLISADACMRTMLSIAADPASYPLVFHCAVGKDRTGIAALVILSLLG